MLYSDRLYICQLGPFWGQGGKKDEGAAVQVFEKLKLEGKGMLGASSFITDTDLASPPSPLDLESKC